jgi:glyoxylase-like metal-dependent hydrolase (beta-lactamase superfamily II)
MESGITGLDPIYCGDITTPRAYAFRPRDGRLTGVGAVLRPGSEQITMPVLAFAVHHPTAGTVLIDTGLHADAIRDLRADFDTFLAFLFRTLRPAGEPFDEQLGELGIAPAAVELVVMTHLHVDHTSGMRLLPSAEFVCAREEWAAATGARPNRGGYAPAHLPDAGRMRLVDFARDGESHGPFSRTIDLLGDGSIRLVSTAGHTRGHLSVLLRRQDGSEVLLVGDAAYTLESIREQRLPLVTVDDEVYARSLRELKAYRDENPGARVVPSHDEHAWRTLVQDSPAVARTP